jgi:hypothetical protein
MRIKKKKTRKKVAFLSFQKIMNKRDGNIFSSKILLVIDEKSN